MPLRILLDEHLSPSIAHDLAALGYEVVCARDRGLANRGIKDWQLMDWCIAHGYTICTINGPDFEREHLRRRARAQEHCGVLIIGEWPTPETYWTLRQYLEASPEPLLLMNQAIYLPKATAEYIQQAETNTEGL